MRKPAPLYPAIAFVRAGWHDTLFDRLAKQLGVPPTRVREVARGTRKSMRIYDAIVEAVREMDDDLERLAVELAATHDPATCPHCAAAANREPTA